MKIGPVDIRNHTFTKRMRGVDETEVRDYLELVAERLEDAIQEGEDLRSRIDRLESQLDDYRTLEKTMRDSLLSAERVADDRMSQAEKEARIVVKGAEVEADKVVGRARQELGRLQAEIDDLRRQRVTYVERFRALLRSQEKILEASVESFDPENGIAEIRDVVDRAARPPSPRPVPVPEARPVAPPPEVIPTPGPIPAPGSPPPLTSYLGEEGLFSSSEPDPPPEGENA